MKKIVVMRTSVMLAATTTATAGGILTNTNQSIDFLRNPARDAAIGLDGVYSNHPAWLSCPKVSIWD